MIEAFLLGSLATVSAAAGVFFLRFWRDSRDTLFLAFAFFFLAEAVNRILLLFASKPNEGSPVIYLVRLFAMLLIIAAVLKKTYGRSAH